MSDFVTMPSLHLNIVSSEMHDEAGYNDHSSIFLFFFVSARSLDFFFSSLLHSLNVYVRRFQYFSIYSEFLDSKFKDLVLTPVVSIAIAATSSASWK